MLSVGEDDAVIAISFPRYSNATLKGASYCRNVGARVIGITNSAVSPLAESCDHVLVAKSDMLSLVDSLVAPLSIVNALIVAIGQRREQEMSRIFENLEKIWEEYEVYEGVVDYLKNFSVSERDMTKYIIGTMSNLDQPMTPVAKGDRSMNLYMNHVKEEMIREERNQILDAKEEDIRALADVVAAALACNQLCVIGGEDKIEEQKDLFMEVKNLF